MKCYILCEAFSAAEPQTATRLCPSPTLIFFQDLLSIVCVHGCVFPSFRIGSLETGTMCSLFNTAFLEPATVPETAGGR